MHSTQTTRCALTAIVGALGLALPAAAETAPPLSSVFHVDPLNPERSVPSAALRNAQPLEFGYFLQDLVTLAETAARSGDHNAEAKYYRALVAAVPDSGVGFSRLCASLEADGRRDEALTVCRHRLGLPEIDVKDYVRFVNLVLARKGDLTVEEREDVSQIAAHLRQKPETRIAGNHLQCELGVRVENVPLLEECTADLARLAPRDPKTLAFQWALAVRKGDRAEARLLIERARSAGISGPSIVRMERATIAMAGGWRRWLSRWWILVGLLAMVATGAALWYRRAPRLPPPPARRPKAIAL